MPHAVHISLGSGFATSLVDAATSRLTRQDTSFVITDRPKTQLPPGAMPPMNLPPILTPTLIKRISSQPNLPANVWYYVAGVTLSSINRPDEIAKVFQHAIEKSVNDPSGAAPSHTESLQIARRMREALVKSGAIVGLPKSINALFALKSVTPADLLDEPAGDSPTSRASDVYTTPSAKILKRGQRFFEQVYGKVSKKVMGQMDNSGTEDLGVTARLMYGYLLSNTDILSPVETSWVLMAGLIPQDVNPQLKGHLRGALNNGATSEQVLAVREIVIAICEASGMKRLDEDIVQGYGWRGDIATL
ncbi:hypothetical protein LTS18_008236 [Coniosporium uncinatum]|uniref:Uncharacterized protein n=1 Tax=Coniosporium uncinatum TaxID=93489 RepID=A0ACC3DWU3_9PEZI|nr:hypothetical protein LTS18_008236 [Coniosporium uncinatum]